MPAPTAFRRRASVQIDGNGTERALAASRTVAPQRRSTTAIILAVLSLAGGALAGVIAYKAASNRQSLLAASHAIAAGHVLTPGDLRVVDMSTDGEVPVVPASDENSIIGRTIGVPIAAGALLTSSELGSMPAVGPGEAVVGVLCKAGQYPPALAPGDTVEIVDSGESASGSGAAPSAGTPQEPALAPTLHATVVGVDAPTDTATVGTVVSLRLAATDAPSVSRAAAAGHIALILVRPGG